MKGGEKMAKRKVKKQETAPYKFLEAQPPDPPVLMNNVVNVFIHGIPPDSFVHCMGEDKRIPSSREDLHKALDKFVRQRLNEIALYEYCTWINGQIPFVTPRELELWRLRQFVEFLWFWNLPDDDDLSLIFNSTKRKASNLASDFLARFRKTILFPVAIRRLFEMLYTKPLKENVQHPRKSWNGCIYRIDYYRYLEHLNALIAEIIEQTRKVLIDACFFDRDESLIWLPTELRDIVLGKDDLREHLFSLYQLPRGGN